MSLNGAPALFKGYVRDDGRVGTASYWLVFPLVFCENRNVSKLTNALNDALGYTNNSLKKFALNLTSGSDELIETARMFRILKVFAVLRSPVVVVVQLQTVKLCAMY